MKRSKLNLPPGSVVYTGTWQNTITSIEVFTYSETKVSHNLFTDSDYEPELLKMTEMDGITWVNIVGLNVVDTIIGIGESFGLSPMVLEDIVHVSQRSKIEIGDQMIFSIFKMLYGLPIVHEHLSIILMDRLVITFQENEGDVFGSIRQQIKTGDGKLRKMGADYLYYCMLDALVDHQLEIVNWIGDEIDRSERKAIDSASLNLDQLFKTRKELLLVRSSVLPFKDIMIELSSAQNHWIGEEVKIFLRDVNDHVSHVTDTVNLYREMVNNLYELNMLSTSDRMNHIMTILTVFSAIFIPLNFLTGFFGMNFKYFPGMDNQMAIPIFVVGCIGIATTLYLLFKKKKWF